VDPMGVLAEDAPNVYDRAPDGDSLGRGRALACGGMGSNGTTTKKSRPAATPHA
jgi:hypothetical protein